MEYGIIEYSPEGEKGFWDRYLFWQNQAKAVFPEEAHRVRWLTKANLFRELCKQCLHGKPRRKQELMISRG
jgi:hypothetical protein